MEVNESDMDGVRIRKNQREKERVTALKSHFMDLKRRLPFPEEQVKTRAQILIRAAEYVDALERRIFQMQDSQNSDERNKEEIFRKDLSSCRFSSVSFDFVCGGMKVFNSAGPVNYCLLRKPEDAFGDVCETIFRQA
ncbi:hypothetical protein P5673_019534 [Acropora cervicornis]|uniref:BHLH domain-containing protein n=1 Tax=Acropora cervicornis TaxID=6130 RepID=A0AAD9QAY2_ACRCE|nr:hypothetical protein P5673_019534 [Acropora cervicornis]